MSPGNSPDSPRGRLAGAALVGLQLGLLAALGLAAAPRFWAAAVPAPAWALLAAAVALGLWSLCANPPGNFNVRPAPKAGARLVCGGPYRWVRHPMYTSVLLFCAACALALGHALAGAAVLAMFGVLRAKARLEERWMALQHPGYAAYRERTKRFLPGLY